MTPGAVSMNRAHFSFLATSEGANTNIPFSSSSLTYVEVQMANSIYSNYWSQRQKFTSPTTHPPQTSPSFGLMKQFQQPAAQFRCSSYAHSYVFNTEQRLFRWMRRGIYKARDFLVPYFFYELSVRYPGVPWICAWASYYYSRSWVGQAPHSYFHPSLYS